MDLFPIDLAIPNGTKQTNSIRFEIGRFFRGRILCVGHSSLDLDLS